MGRQLHWRHRSTARGTDTNLWRRARTANTVITRCFRIAKASCGRALGPASGLTDRKASCTGVREEGRAGCAYILEDHSGTLWFGTSGQGLFSYRDSAFFDPDHGRWPGVELDSGALRRRGRQPVDRHQWEGMNRLRNGQLASIRPADGLWDGVAQTILEDKNGHFWMTCNRGFYRVARADLIAFSERSLTKVSSTVFGQGNALRSTLFAPTGGAIDHAGRLWLPSNKGLVIVDPLQLPSAGNPPMARLESVTINGENSPASAQVTLPPGGDAVDHPLYRDDAASR